MKKLSENKSKDVIPSDEELELAKILEEIEQDERLRDITVPEEITRKLYAQIAAYEAAKSDMDSEEMTQEVIARPEDFLTEAELKEIQAIESMKKRFPDMTAKEIDVFRAGLQYTREAEDADPIADSIADNQPTEDVLLEDGKVRIFKKRTKKFYLLVAAVAVLSVGIGTVGFGEDFKWLEVGEQEIDSYSSVKVESDTDVIDAGDMEEQAAYEYAEELLGVPVIKLPRKGDGFDFELVQSYGSGAGVDMIYSYDDKTIYYTIVQNYGAVSHNEIVTGTLLEAYEVEAVGGIILVEQYLESDNSTIMKATFRNNNVYYSIKGAADTEEFEEILKNIIFF